jgi:diguanylate cyclase (GGDEF)-like protein/PAS domain S-box-containing protein
MTLWPANFPLALHAWLPLGLAALVPLALLAAFIAASRRRLPAIATVLALRTVLLLGAGFAILVSVATFSVVHTGLRELRERHESDVRTLAHELERVPRAMLPGEAPLRFALFRAKNASVAFIAVSGDACVKSCTMSAVGDGLNPTDARKSVARFWPGKPGREVTVALSGKPYLFVAESLIDGASSRGLVVAAIEAEYLAVQATRTAWILLGISYLLLVVVGWSSWRLLNSSLGTRIHAITSQIRKGSVEEPIETLQIEGAELRELADSVSSYISATLEAQKSSDERYRRLVELAPDAIVMCSNASIKFANPAALRLSGTKSRYDIIGVPIEQFLELDRGGAARSGGTRSGKWKRVDGRVLHVEVAEIADASEGTAQYLIRDVTDARNREEALAHRAEHDSLTGLVNRARFEGRLAELLEPGSSSSRLGQSRQIAVMFIDLDGFKPVNDRYGHAAGDAVLVAVAERLRDSTRGSDLVARLGGDEFAVLLEVRDHAEVTAVSERILSSLERPIEFDGSELRIGASIGIADTHVGDGETPLSAAELLRTADAAMYTVKQAGGSRAAA